MELYDKKFFINGNCMIRSFGQPGFKSIMQITQSFFKISNMLQTNIEYTLEKF